MPSHIHGTLKNSRFLKKTKTFLYFCKGSFHRNFINLGQNAWSDFFKLLCLHVIPNVWVRERFVVLVLQNYFFLQFYHFREKHVMRFFQIFQLATALDTKCYLLEENKFLYKTLHFWKRQNHNIIIKHLSICTKRLKQCSSNCFADFDTWYRML